MKQFGKETINKLKCYVYALVNPFTDEIFYVGRGKGNRAFSHLKIDKNSKLEKEKMEKIRVIREQGEEPTIEILRYGLTIESAKEIEATVIDAIALEYLTNQNRGADIKRGRVTAKIIEYELGGYRLDISKVTEPSILFYCHQAYRVPEDDLYDSTRQFWKLNKNRIMKKNGEHFYYRYAFAMKHSLVLEVYEILAWYKAGTTVSSREINIEKLTDRWEFIGKYADDKIRKKYKNKTLERNGDL